ncbi:MAG: twin-arginine translocase TatA/TatE family subunit [Anaerolineaceae bacterium]
MPFRIGWPELLIILLILLVLFGPRLTRVAGDLAKGIKIFRRNLNEDEEAKKKTNSEDESL